MYINFDTLEESLNPLDLAINNDMYNAINICSSIQVPADFPMIVELNRTPIELNSIREGLEKNYKDIDRKIDALIYAEKKNLEVEYEIAQSASLKNRISSLNNLIRSREERNQEREGTMAALQSTLNTALLSKSQQLDNIEKAKIENQINSAYILLNQVQQTELNMENKVLIRSTAEALTVLMNTVKSGEEKVWTEKELATLTKLINKSKSGREKVWTQSEVNTIRLLLDKAKSKNNKIKLQKSLGVQTELQGKKETETKKKVETKKKTTTKKKLTTKKKTTKTSTKVKKKS